MDSLLEMLRTVVVFLLAAGLIRSLFTDETYKKYVTYAISLIVMVMVLVPVLQLFGKGETWKSYLQLADYEQQADQTREEIQLLGEAYEEKLLRETIAGQCGTTAENCELQMEDGELRMIRVRVEKMPDAVDTLVSSLALCYGLAEENIYIEEMTE